VLIALGVAGRLLPHPPNFTPMAAIALFSGFIFGMSLGAIAVVNGLLWLFCRALSSWECPVVQ
ncbi:MAG TPA: DUF6580 family putative transport protein, partial [Anaerolineales bacterium]|nr:DUF6580 family putative transport protein [Anaerolineales bacterium]